LGLAQGTARASNFRPSAAKAIYGLYAKDRVVWDMSCGWGGRLLGALATPVKKYIGTDPSTKTFEGLKRLADEIGKWSRTKVELHCCGSETFIPKEPVDLCFTSPPYFDTEKYSDEPTQSYLKYPSREKWVNGFLLTTIKNCHKCLRSDGVLVLNVWPSMEEDTTAVAKRAGFVLDKKLQLALSYMPGRNRKKEGEKQAKWKYEPCFIFRKV
jgi:predicted RNA methylase